MINFGLSLEDVTRKFNSGSGRDKLGELGFLDELIWLEGHFFFSFGFLFFCQLVFIVCQLSLFFRHVVIIIDNFEETENNILLFDSIFFDLFFDFFFLLFKSDRNKSPLFLLFLKYPFTWLLLNLFNVLFLHFNYLYYLIFLLIVS